VDKERLDRPGYVWALGRICLTLRFTPLIIKLYPFFLVFQPIARRLGPLLLVCAGEATSLAILIGLALLVVATIVIAFYASRVWHWSHVLVVVGLVISTAGFFVLSAEVLRINAVLRNQYNQTQARLDDVNAQITALRKGTDDGQMIGRLRGAEVSIPDDATSVPSLADLEHELRLQAQFRGPVWRNVTPTQVDPETGGVRVTVQPPAAAGLVAEAVVYVFEEGEPSPSNPSQGAQYLGEFRVDEMTGQEAVLLPAIELSEPQRQRLASSRGPWVIYEVMPRDRHGLFAGLSEEELRQKLPAESVEEYLRHGKPANPGDDEYRKAAYDEAGNRIPPEQMADAAEANYSRRLREYALELRELTERRALFEAELAGVMIDNARLTEALASAQRMSEFRQDEIVKLNHDLAGLAKERQALEQLLTMIQRQVAAISQMLERTQSENIRLAQELAARQAAALEASRQAAARNATAQVVADSSN
jgi:hypothetical protein